MKTRCLATCAIYFGRLHVWAISGKAHKPPTQYITYLKLFVHIFIDLEMVAKAAAETDDKDPRW